MMRYDTLIARCNAVDIECPINEETFNELKILPLPMDDLLDISIDITKGYTLEDLLPGYLQDGTRIRFGDAVEISNDFII